MKMDGGVMKMRAVDKLALPAGKPVDLKPGGYHVMLMDLKQPLKEGETVPVTLTFVDKDGQEDDAGSEGAGQGADGAGGDAQALTGERRRVAGGSQDRASVVRVAARAVADACANRWNRPRRVRRDVWCIAARDSR